MRIHAAGIVGKHSLYEDQQTHADDKSSWQPTRQRQECRQHQKCADIANIIGVHQRLRLMRLVSTFVAALPQTRCHVDLLLNILTAAQCLMSLLHKSISNI